MPVIHPSSPFVNDGEISVKLEGKYSNRPLEFRLLDGDNNVVVDWSPPDVHGGREKTFSNLFEGLYKVEVDSDAIRGKQTCVDSVYVELQSNCPTQENGCECGYALRIDEILNNRVEFINKSTTNPNELFPAYKIGTGDMTMEGWLYFNNDDKLARPFGFGTTPASTDIINLLSLVLNQGYTGVGPTFYVRGSARFGASSVVSSNPKNSTTDSMPSVEPLFEKDTWNHFVLTRKLVESPADTVNCQTFKLYINGYEISLQALNAVETIGSITQAAGSFEIDDYNANSLPTSSVITIGEPYNNSNFASNYLVTNFRVYNRELRRSEIQRNYLAGCHGDPNNCAGLILWAPLNQSSGNQTKEIINGNFGKLTNYSTSELKPGGGAWQVTCCDPVAEYNIYSCCVQECDPDFATITFDLENYKDDSSTNMLKVIFGGQTDSCPIPDKAPQPTDKGVQPNFDFIITGVNSTERAEDFVDQWNTLLGDYSRSTAENNLSEVTIKFPIPEFNFLCNKVFTVCSYQRTSGSGTPADPYIYEEASNPLTSFIKFPRTNSVICCLPDLDCCNLEGDRKLEPIGIEI